jgi:hypothetical protein
MFGPRLQRQIAGAVSCPSWLYRAPIMQITDISIAEHSPVRVEYSWLRNGLSVSPFKGIFPKQLGLIYNSFGNTEITEAQVSEISHVVHIYHVRHRALYTGS